MKNISIVGMAMLLIFSLAGCGTNQKTDDQNAADQGTATNTENVDNNGTANENNANDNNAEGTSDHKIDIAEEAADNIVKIDGVDYANVLVTNNNAYAGVMLKEGVEGTKEMEDKIADEVRATTADINNVYVSLNPDFAKQMTDYGDKIRAGEPVEGFFKEFTDAISRVFPDAH
ncbi:YhcN/YlaJ family sporulation lipoprotein [Sporosarcina sp. HYO08]|uniref:YhcN/YlaJ family sporulation lipoprotein n=1 Tax=Sporosarcina sp. HYO08 TaxID=1759557 RepID=UPI000796F77B|nr:YhcN/YlaJ family sporulation lipoprotein [Sporosarcina sp. HYO08]KXH80076.1 hypothetical protein AU377_11425 [Sporosarcina sp. HYO08]